MTTRHPITDLAGHLMWTRQGVVWATWRLEAQPWNRGIEDKRTVAGLHRLLLRALEGESLLCSSMIATDPMEVVEGLLEGMDLAQVPGWVAEVEASIEVLAELPLGQRAFWLSVPLSNKGADRWRAPLRAGWHEVGGVLGLPQDRPCREDLARRAAQARAVEALIPAPFTPRRVSPAEQVWLHNHAARRGLVDESIPEPGGLAGQMQLATPAAMVEPILDEGGRCTEEQPPSRADVLGSRFLKVIDAVAHDLGSQPASYQALLALADTPAGGLAFPGAEVLFELDRTGMDVDWAIRMRTHSRQHVQLRNRKAVAQLNEQYGQRDGGVSTGQHDLDLAAELLAEYDRAIAADDTEVEVEHTIILALGVAHQDGQDGTQARELVSEMATELVQHLLGKTGMRFERLAGQQEALWWQMLPGAPRTEKLLRAYAQFTTATHLAKLVPVIAYRLGGDSGPLLAIDKEMSRPHPVHIDLGGYPELDLSGSIQFVGELGAGKSVGQKTVMSHIVERGGKFFEIDKSEDGEWAFFARTFDNAVIVDPEDPAWSMDPLRVLGPGQGSELAASFVTLLIGLDIQDPMGRVLTRVLTPRYLAAHHLQGLGDVVEHIVALGGEEPAAAELGDRLAGWAEKPLARVMFDPFLPPIDTTAQATVFRTHCMSQPTATQLEHAHLFKSLPPERIFGRAYYRVLIGTSRTLAFVDRSQVAAVGADEIYDVATNPENVADLEAIVRRGRRVKALFVAGGHDQLDGGSEIISGLIPTRVLMRQRDKTLATRALQWMGHDPGEVEFPDLLERLMKDTSPLLGEDVPVERRGECYIRDAFGSVGWGKILPPANPARRAAVFSTPPTTRVRQRSLA